MHVHDDNTQNDDDCAMKNGYIIKLPVKHAIVKWPHQMWISGFSQSSPPPTMPSQDVTDHISGKTFFIRSKADPRDFWHVPREGAYVGKLRVSRDNRTRFRIAAKGAPAPLNGGPIVMIGSDAIEIAEARTGRVVAINSRGYLTLGVPVSVNAAMYQLVVEERAEAVEQLVVEEREEDRAPAAEAPLEGHQDHDAQIFFKDLRARFAVVPEDNRTTSARMLEAGDGEEWELV